MEKSKVSFMYTASNEIKLVKYCKISIVKNVFSLNDGFITNNILLCIIDVLY